MAEWCADNGIRTKGHPLCWHETVPEWLKGGPLDEVNRLATGRIEREVTGFAGLIECWDVVNEVAVMPKIEEYRKEPPGSNPISTLCRSLGQEELVRRTFDAARNANPEATLVLNDYDVSERVPVGEELSGRGVGIDVIGVQSHMDKGYWGAWRNTSEVCERFAGSVGKPLHFTELTILSGKTMADSDNDWSSRRTDWRTSPADEAAQAEHVVEFYRLLFSHRGGAGDHVVGFQRPLELGWRAVGTGAGRHDTEAGL